MIKVVVQNYFYFIFFKKMLMLGSNFYLKEVKKKLYVHFLYPKSRGSNMWDCDWKPPPPTPQRHFQNLGKTSNRVRFITSPFLSFFGFHSLHLVFHYFIPFNKSLSNSLSKKKKMEFVNTHFDVEQTFWTFMHA